jgi:hypothetical protein
MFGIEWLRNRVVVETETSPLKSRSEAIASAYARAPEVSARLVGREPDSFRLKDASGQELSVHALTSIGPLALFAWGRVVPTEAGIMRLWRPS